ncbi:MAG: Protein-glutamate methylesterase [Bradyrhizobium sp.]|nr:Protein-glutamate methylesterase [Bradyrhizobium sp.]
MDKATHRLFVIGASAGGVEALFALSSKLPRDFPAPIMVVQHIGAYRSYLPELISRRGPNKAVEAKDGELPLPGTIYIAPPDFHMMLQGAVIRLTRGPKEHHTRPAIDPLFRSAAIEFGSQVVGIVLTGMLDDGAAGLRAIKDCGGIAIVQDPNDAIEPSMPTNALRVVDADHVTALENIAPLMCLLAGPRSGASDKQPPDWLKLEQACSFGDPEMKTLSLIGSPSPFTCPDCGGSLFELHDKNPLRFRCHTGHGFSIRTLASTQEEIAENALWSGIRALQERIGILEREGQMTEKNNGPGDEERDRRKEIDNLSQAAAVLKSIAEKTPLPGDA